MHRVRANRIVFAGMIVLVIIAVAIVVRRLALLASSPAVGDLATVPAKSGVAFDQIFARQRYLTLVHILPGLLFVLLGPIQFAARFRARHLVWHRWIGILYLLNGAVVGVTALVMSVEMPAIGGFSQAVATTVFALIFLFALAKGYWHIRRGNVARHREWMIRGFAVGLAVATIRPIVGFFFATSHWSGLNPQQFFGAAFWLGFVLHLIAAEAWINGTRSSGVT